MSNPSDVRDVLDHTTFGMTLNRTELTAAVVLALVNADVDVVAGPDASVDLVVGHLAIVVQTGGLWHTVERRVEQATRDYEHVILVTTVNQHRFIGLHLDPDHVFVHLVPAA